MPKKSSETAAAKRVADPSPEQVDALVNRFVDRPYNSTAVQDLAKQAHGGQGVKPSTATKAKPISISLPPDVIAALEDQVIQNKRSGEGPRTVSGLIKLALRHYGYKI